MNETYRKIGVSVLSLGAFFSFAAEEGGKEGGEAAAGAEKVYLEEKFLDIQSRVEAIGTLLQRKEWGQALMRIRKLLDEAEYQSALYPEDGREACSRYIPLRRYLHELVLQTFPAEELSTYRSQIEPQVARAIKTAQEEGDLETLRRLSEAADATPQAYEARRTLGDAAWERGALAQACEHWRTILAPENEEWKAKDGERARNKAREQENVRARLLLGLAAQGRYAEAREAARAFPGEPLAAGGIPFEPAAWAAKLPERSPGQGEVADNDWLQYGGNNRGSCLAPPIQTEISELKGNDTIRSASSARNPIQNRNIRVNRQPGQPQSADDTCPYFPSVYNDKMFLFDGYNLKVYDTETGKLVYAVIDEKKTGVSAPAAGAIDPFTGQPMANKEFRALTIAPPSLYAVVQKEDTGPKQANNPFGQPMRTTVGKLESYDVNTYKLTGRYELAADKPPLSLVGAPLVSGKSIYCPAIDPANSSGTLYLVRFDAESKAERWRTYLGSSSLGGGGNRFNPFAGASKALPATLAESDGTLYALTNRGSVVALRSDSGERLWASRYAVNLQKMQGGFRGAGSFVGEGWSVNPVIVHAGKVVVAPCDSRNLIAYESTTGKVEWEWRPMGPETSIPFKYVLGPAKGLLFLVGGTRGVVVDVQSGARKGAADQPQIRIPDTGCIGRPVLSENTLYIPYKKGVISVDLQTFKLGKEIVLWESTGGAAATLRQKQEGGNLILTEKVLVAVSDESFRIYSVLRPEQAEKGYLKKVETEPQQSRNYQMLARLYLRQEREEEAYAILARGAGALERGGDADGTRRLVDEMAAVLSQRSRRLIASGKSSEAAAWITQLLARQPQVLSSPAFLDELGQTHVLAGEWDKALQAYDTMLALSEPAEFSREGGRFSRAGLAVKRIQEILSAMPADARKGWISRKRSEVESALKKEKWDAAFQAAYAWLASEPDPLWDAALKLMNAKRSREGLALEYEAVRRASSAPRALSVPAADAETWLALAAARFPEADVAGGGTVRDALRSRVGPLSAAESVGPPLAVKWKVEREGRPVSWTDDGSVGGIQWVVLTTGKVYNLETGKLKASLEGFNKTVRWAGFSGGKLVIRDADSVRGYDPATLAAVWSVTVGESPAAASAAAAADPAVQQQLMMQAQMQGRQYVAPQAGGLDESGVACRAGLLVAVSASKAYGIDCATGERIWEADAPSPQQVWISPQGRAVVAGGDLCQVRDARTGRKLGELSLGSEAAWFDLRDGAGESCVVVRQAAETPARLDLKAVAWDAAGTPRLAWELPVDGAGGASARTLAENPRDLYVAAGQQVLVVDKESGKRKDSIPLAELRAKEKGPFSIQSLQVTDSGLFAFCAGGGATPQARRQPQPQAGMGKCFLIYRPLSGAEGHWISDLDIGMTGSTDLVVAEQHAFFTGLVAGVGAAPAPHLLGVETRSGKIAEKLAVGAQGVAGLWRRKGGILLQMASNESTLIYFQQSSR